MPAGRWRSRRRPVDGLARDAFLLIETLPELFRRGRPADPSAVLLRTADGTTLSYGEADRRSAQLAHALAARGVQRGDRVALQVAKSPDALLLWLACVRTGAVLLPLNPAYTEAEVAALVDDAGAALVLDDEALAALVADAGARPTEFADEELGPDDPAAIVYTSGTTGRPKGAVLSHRNLASNADVLRQVWGLHPDDVLLHALPFFHVHGLFVATHCVLASGSSMVFLPRFEVGAVLEAMPRCSVLMGVPTFYTRLLDDPRLDRSVCRTLRLCISGSAPLLATTHEAFRARTGHVILERYGMTETSMLTSNPLEGERRPGTVGLALPGVEVRLAATDEGGAGEVEVRGPNVLRGYWRRPDLQREVFTDDGFFRTGDIGAFDDDGYLRIVGRSKDLVITGGLNVHPVEVEAVVDALDDVLESAVIGVPDADLGEVVVAVVVGQLGRTVDPERVRAAVRLSLAGFKVPKRVEIVDALPRNAMGKVEKAVLRQRFGS